MSRALLLIPIAGLVGLPLLAWPSSHVGWLATTAGLLCAAGALGRSLALASAGTMVAVVGYALALWLASSPLDTLGAIAFSIALVLVLEGTAFARRFHRASVHPSVVRGQARSWIGLAVASAVIVTVLDGLASLLVFVAPAPAYAAIAAVGALGAVLGVVGMVKRRAHSARRRD